MPPLPLPPELDDVVLRPNPAVVATVRSDGTPHSAATWYDWVDGRLLLNMDESRARLGHLRERPHISLTVFDGDNWGRHVTLLGPVVSIEPDPDLADIDRLAVRYTGKPFGTRDRGRVTAWAVPERWSSWPLPAANAR
jgi:PPOX class probable F420-dependent enzyme